MDWIILGWTVVCIIVYVGGYLFPASIGIYTRNFAAVYGVVLIASVAAWALRLAAPKRVDEPTSKSRRK